MRKKKAAKKTAKRMTLSEQLAEERARRIGAERELSDVEEREARCCPEDFGFDEYIDVLRKRIAELAPDAPDEPFARLARGEEMDRHVLRIMALGWPNPNPHAMPTYAREVRP